MIIEYIGVKEINGSLIALDGVKDATFEETVSIRLDNGTERAGRIVQMEGERVVIQVFEGTNGIALDNTRTRLLGHPVEMPLSPELLGRPPHRRPGRYFSGGATGHQRHRHQPRVPGVSPELHRDRHLLHRLHDDPDPGPEAAYFLRLRHAA